MMFSLLIPNAFSSQWAVLMAGSRGYNNYRHQADVFNLYTILTSRGFDKKHIITIAYDDVATHKLNPFKGQIFSTKDHHNVYPGHGAIDYSGKDATAENFLRVLLGDNRKGRALESTEEDDIFIYYNDHGAPGLLCVPANNGPQLYADQLTTTFQKMKDKKMFHNAFFVIEACYSGSVGYNITTPGVFVTVAAGPQQSSYSADWDKELDAFRTNEFTKHFTRFILKHPNSKIIDFVNQAAFDTLRSHVCAFGDFDVAQRKLSDFLLSAEPIDVPNDEEQEEEDSNSISLASNGDIDFRTKNAFVTFLQKKLSHSEGEEKINLQRALNYEIARRKKSSMTFKQIARHFDANGESYGDLDAGDIIYDCYRTAVEGFRLFCGEVDEYELSKLAVFGHLCKKTTKEQLISEIREICPQNLWKEEDLYV